MILLGLRKDSQDISTFMTGSGSWKEMDVAAGSHGSGETAVKLRVPRLLGGSTVKKQVKIVSAIRERIRSRLADRLGIGGEDETQESPPPVSTPPPNTPPPNTPPPNTPPPTTIPPPRTTTPPQNPPGQGQTSPSGNDETSDSISSTKETADPSSTTRGTGASQTEGTATSRSTAAPSEDTTSGVPGAATSASDAPVTTILVEFGFCSITVFYRTSRVSPRTPSSAIAGIVAGVVLGALALILIVAFLVWRRRRAARVRGLSFENISYPFTTGNTSFSSASMSYHPPLSPLSRAYMGIAGHDASQMRQGSIDTSSISSSTTSSMGVVVTASRRDVLSNASFTEVDSVISYPEPLQGANASRWSSTVDTHHRDLPPVPTPMSADSHAGMSQISDPLWDVPPVPGVPHPSGVVVGSRWSSTVENGQSSSPPATTSEESGALAPAGDRLRSPPPSAAVNRSRWSSTVDTHGTSLYPASTSEENIGPSPEVHQDPFSDDSRVSRETVRGTSGSSHEVGGLNETLRR
ncbi:hypothetical protein PQX77_010573 [Marasmius sp. AFHP31]|nr:hypothetical protein PQX77_010573 [Marasmius sp. AFHP31]